MENKEKLSWEEIKKQYDTQWVELVDYDWPEEEPYPRMGTVRVHAKTRSEFNKLILKGNPPKDFAIIFVGEPHIPSNKIPSSFGKVEIKPLDA